MRRRIAGISLAAMLAATVFAVAAGANPPDHFTDAEDYSGVAPCAGFDNYYEGHLDISGITTFDKQGSPVEDVVHISGWERNWRSDKPQVSITAKRQFNVAPSTHRRRPARACSSTTSGTSSSTTPRAKSLRSTDRTTHSREASRPTAMR